MRLTEDKQHLTISEIYGPLIGGKDLVQVLGFKTSAAFRRAVRMNMLGVKTFNIEARRGKFAFSKDVDEWLKKLEVVK